MIIESIRIALRALAANKLRAALTMLGIIIGVGAVITLMAAGEGVQHYIAEQFAGLGSNLLFVMPGKLENARFQPPGMSSAELTDADADALIDPLLAPDVAEVAAIFSRMGTPVIAGTRSTLPQVQGVPPAYFRMRHWKPSLGDLYTDSEMVGRSRVAVLGSRVVEDLFPEGEYPVGQTIKINQVPFRVSGVLEEKGGSSEDNVVLIPLTTAHTRLFSARTTAGDNKVTYILVQASSEERMDAAAEQVTAILRERHKITFRDDDDFSVISQSDILSVFGDITGMLTIFLGAIAGISLVVGGIGIMNIMLVSVTERTREIGLRKAVGAKQRDILTQFLIEAIVLSMIGGALGIALGQTGALVIARLIEGFMPIITLDTVLLATSFSAAVGLFFGLYPAWRASRLNPIDALRYE
ncbi:MAG: ABC transporter permease [Thermoflexales bacterium]|nr:ABC transporter permease [Thermoflexales bacterium]